MEITQTSLYPLEGEQSLTEGDQVAFSIVKQGVTTITNDANLRMYAYKGSTDVTDTFFTGSMSATGNVATTKTSTGLRGGDRLHITVSGTCDGMTYTFAKFWLRVDKRSGK